MRAAGPRAHHLLAGLMILAACSRGTQGTLSTEEDLRPPSDATPMPTGDLRITPSDRVSFGTATTYPVHQFAYHFAVARIDGDDLSDLVVSGRPDATVLLSRGDGTFTSRMLGLGQGGNWQIAAAEMNGDGKTDLVFTHTAAGGLFLALGSGDGDFRPGATVPAGRTPQGVAAADVNGDRAVDLLAADQGEHQLIVLLGRGDGTFAAGMRQPTGRAPLWVETGDINRDGRMDAAVSNLSSASISIFLGRGDGTFAPMIEVKTVESPVVLRLADLDLDGDLDLAVNSEGAANSIAVHLGNGDGTYGAAQLLRQSAGSGQGLAVADLNADGLPDLIGVCAFSSPARVFLGLGGGSFAPERTFPGGTRNVFNVAATDWNRDGLPDLALSEGSDRRISILLNTTGR